jgi:protein archease
MVELSVMSYEILDHTADLCIRVTGRDFKDFLRNASLAMMDQITDRDKVEPSVKETIEVTGETNEEILVRLLSEILYLHETSKLVFNDIRVEVSNENKVVAELQGERYYPRKHELYLEIKAVTYHDLKVEMVNDKFTADIVFDI